MITKIAEDLPGNIAVNLRGKRVVVNGGSSGIGHAACRLFLDCGAQVLFSHRGRHPASATRLEAMGAVGWVNGEEGVDPYTGFAEFALGLFKEVDILVNCAGGSEGATPLPGCNPSAFKTVFEANVWSAVACTSVLERSLRRQLGAVVNVASVVADLNPPGIGFYSAAKAAVVSLTKTWAKELAPAVRVNAVAPGPVLTPKVLQDPPHAEVLIEVARKSPRGRPSTAAEVAEAVLFLATAQGTTGEVLHVSGGLGCE